MLEDGTLEGYIDEPSVTGQTSNPTIFDKAISSGHDYDEQIADLRDAGNRARADLRDRLLRHHGPQLFEPEHERTDRMDGWVSPRSRR